LVSQQKKNDISFLVIFKLNKYIINFSFSSHNIASCVIWKAKMGCLDMEYYLPIMAMVLIEFIYAGLGIGTRIVFLQGLSPRVFVMYRHAIATILLAPVAYFSGYVFYHLHFSFIALYYFLL